MLRVFFKPRPDPAAPDWKNDPVALLRVANEAKARAGVAPEVPPFVLKELPRWTSN